MLYVIRLFRVQIYFQTIEISLYIVFIAFKVCLKVNLMCTKSNFANLKIITIRSSNIYLHKRFREAGFQNLN